MEQFFPQIQVKTKEERERNTFLPRVQDEDHTQIIGGDTAKLLGGIYPPRVSAPLFVTFHL